MQSAFFPVRIFPPPPARTKIFSRTNRTGARLAANAHKTTVVQNIIGYVVFRNILENLFLFPMQQGIVFIELSCFIPFQQIQLIAIGGMFSPYTRYPDFLTRQSAFQWFNFAYKTAGFPVFYGFIKSIGTFLINI